MFQDNYKFSILLKIKIKMCRKNYVAEDVMMDGRGGRAKTNSRIMNNYYASRSNDYLNFIDFCYRNIFLFQVTSNLFRLFLGDIHT